MSTLTIVLRGDAVGAGPDAAGFRALRAALASQDVRIAIEPRDPGGAALPGDGPGHLEGGGAVGGAAHLTWGGEAAAAPGGVPRVLRVTGGPDWADLAPRLAGLDEVWVADDAEAARARAAGVDPARLWVCPEPVAAVGAPWTAPGAHGTVLVALAGPGDEGHLAALAAAWARAVPPDAHATLVVVAPSRPGVDEAGVHGALAEGLRRGGHDPDAVADIVVLAAPLDDAARTGLVAAARALVALDPRGGARAVAEALRAGVPVVGAAEASWGWPATGGGLVGALAAAAGDAPGAAARGKEARRRGGVHAAEEVARAVRDRLTALARRRGVPASGAPVPARPRAVLEGSVFGAHSLAAVNRGLVRALLAGGAVDLAVVNSEGAVLDPAAPLDPSVRPLAWAAARAHAAPDVVLRHGHPADLRAAPDGPRVVAVLPWEFGPPPRDWLAALGATVDEVWVPSTLVRAGWESVGAGEAVVTVPNGIDPVLFRPGAPPADLGDAAPGYRFLYVGGLAWRKGVDLLVRAYRAAFRADDDVTLVIKDFGPGGPYPPDAVDRMVAELAADPRAARVARLTGPLPEGALPGLYRACDCLVHPYRGEAYGLTMAEAMACGLPVIAPDRGAARDYMDPSVALLVPARPVAMEARVVAGHRPAGPPVVHETDVRALAETMRWAYENRPAARGIGARAAARMHARHTWAHAARVAEARLAALAGAPAPARPVPPPPPAPPAPPPSARTPPAPAPRTPRGRRRLHVPREAAR